MLFVICLLLIIIIVILILNLCKSNFKNNNDNIIPQSFKNNMKKYLDSIFENKKIYKDYQVINNISLPNNIKTDHMRCELNSQEHKEVLTELFYLLDIFHKYSIKNNILYYISSGNILGYYSCSSILPWDDDIDIIITDKHFNKLVNLWQNGGKSYKIWDNNWTYKNIKLNNHDIILLKLNNEDFYKIKLSIDKIKYKNQKDIGGLDIATLKFAGKSDGKTPLTNNIIKMLSNKNLNESDFPIIDYGPIKTRILRKDLSLELINDMYPRWKELKHPALFK